MAGFKNLERVRRPRLPRNRVEVWPFSVTCDQFVDLGPAKTQLVSRVLDIERRYSWALRKWPKSCLAPASQFPRCGRRSLPSGAGEICIWHEATQNPPDGLELRNGDDSYVNIARIPCGRVHKEHFALQSGRGEVFRFLSATLVVLD